MKRALILLCPLTLLATATGCDETLLEGLPADVQALVSSVDGVKINLLTQDAQSCDQDRLRLMDGSCDGDGSQYQYQYQYSGSNGAGGNGSGGGSGGSGNGDQLRLRDGSCGDSG